MHLMPHLLTLANDRVPNVRVLLAKTLRQTLLEKGRQATHEEKGRWWGHGTGGRPSGRVGVVGMVWSENVLRLVSGGSCRERTQDDEGARRVMLNFHCSVLDESFFII